MRRRAGPHLEQLVVVLLQLLHPDRLLVDAQDLVLQPLVLLRQSLVLLLQLLQLGAVAHKDSAADRTGRRGRRLESRHPLLRHSRHCQQPQGMPCPARARTLCQWQASNWHRGVRSRVMPSS